VSTYILVPKYRRTKRKFRYICR